VSTTHKMEIYEITNNMNYYVMLFISVNNLLNICDFFIKSFKFSEFLKCCLIFYIGIYVVA
jgi:hypothetical protein